MYVRSSFKLQKTTHATEDTDSYDVDLPAKCIQVSRRCEHEVSEGVNVMSTLL